MTEEFFTLENHDKVVSGRKIVEMKKQAIKDGRLDAALGWGDPHRDAKDLEALGDIKVVGSTWTPAGGS